jgi:hypothetical protein
MFDANRKGSYHHGQCSTVKVSFERLIKEPRIDWWVVGASFSLQAMVGVEFALNPKASTPKAQQPPLKAQWQPRA